MMQLDIFCRPDCLMYQLLVPPFLLHEGQTLRRWRGPGPETAAAPELGCVCVCIVLNSSLPQLSSTPLQVLLYLNSWYFAAFYLAEILMFIYKGQSAHLHMKLVTMKTLGSKINSNFKKLLKKKNQVPSVLLAEVKQQGTQ